MNKTDFRKNFTFIKKVLSFFCLFFSCTLFVGCGMQQYYDLKNAPVEYHAPDYSSTDYTTRYFRFRTADNSSSGDFVALGTAVYYKIYGSSSTLVSETNSIEALNTTSNGSAAAQRLIENLGYQELGSSAGVRSPFIQENSSQVVYIRLMSYGTTSDYAAKVIIDGVEQSWLPVRFDNSHTFEFGRTDSTKYTNYRNNAITSDGDVTGTSSDGVWYVNMYAVAVGRDGNYTRYYSLVTHLGSVAIDSNSPDN